MADLRIFSYMPNPRIWKATIAARLCGVTLDICGARSSELSNWLWDFDARPLNDADRDKEKNLGRQSRTGFSGQLFKTDNFMAAHPFGTVPAAFSPDGTIGIFESNSIARTVARLGREGPALYGDDPYTASRIDSFLDASLVFARDGQIYLLSLSNNAISKDIHSNTKKAFSTYFSGIEEALQPNRPYLVGSNLTLADIVFTSEVCSFAREAVHQERLVENNLPTIFDRHTATSYPRAVAHFETLCSHKDFAPDIAPFMEKINKRRSLEASP